MNCKQGINLLHKYMMFCIGVGVYGFTRGYRSDRKFNNSSESNKRLIGDKISNGLENGLIYTVIPFPFCLRLINRIDIKLSNVDKKEYDTSYAEVTGYCMDTI